MRETKYDHQNVECVDGLTGRPKRSVHLNQKLVVSSRVLEVDASARIAQGLVYIIIYVLINVDFWKKSA